MPIGLYAMPVGFIKLTSAHTNSPVVVKACTVVAIGEDYSANAKPEAEPLYTTVHIAGIEVPLHVNEHMADVLARVAKELDRG